MRFVGSLLLTATLVLWMVCGAAAAGARWLGQQQQGDQFPVPDEQGCWDGLCFFEMAFSDIPAALQTVERISQAARLWNQSSGLEFVYRGAQPFSVVLNWTPLSYSLTSNSAPNRSLMRLGDAVGVLGKPARIMMLEDHVVVEFPARHLYLLVIPAEMDVDRIRLSPRDPVDSLSIFEAGADFSETTFYYPFTQDWKGFGEYKFQ